MKTLRYITVIMAFLLSVLSCKKDKETQSPTQPTKRMTAKEILGNPDYQAISYGGYRKTSREYQPTVTQIKEDLKILKALNIKVLRTYNVQLAQASNLMKAITQLKKEDKTFEMYVMLGAWIDCKNAWTNLEPDHSVESEKNADEIKRAVDLANQYPDIIKIIAVGNEAMVRWATTYYVQPNVILKWVNHLQNLKKEGKLPKDLWVTSSDDFASWGGGDKSYHNKDLEQLIKAVDFISMHTYPYHNTHYNPQFWGIDDEEKTLSSQQKIEAAMQRAITFAQNQYHNVSKYVHSVDSTKQIHIGETGWASISNGHYGSNGSKATDEYKQALYYHNMRDWTNKEGISCFYFEAFDEPWKDAQNDKGSENHFGLFTVDGKAKYALWQSVDDHVFKGLSRDGKPIVKTFDGNTEELMKTVEMPVQRKKLATH
ncbi:glycoside hydrolase family 17 protein [Mangrovimonas spongiae]|uniref:Endo-1,3-beta-glucanase btgC n=1 Tax=Mangrovimonas spongiae TaxID=2494697 RepID=A0A3R9N8F1_9FLAO|nr:glycosyl hydrolase family 17 protein [Mangrovimonas spongiae]RSK41429.1 glycosyl hydrolase family 17 [Mangrovimonas spongiae]